MSDAVAVGCSLLLAWGLFDLARAVRRLPEQSFRVTLRQDAPHSIRYEGEVVHKVRHDEPREPWQGDAP